MKYLRNIRRSTIRHKSDLIVNLLWFLAGLTVVPCISYLVGWLTKWPLSVLYAVVLVEALFLLILAVSLLFLLDKLSIADKQLKNIGETWQELENEADFGDAFDEATKKNS
jgi:hypothetical protein